MQRPQVTQQVRVTAGSRWASTELLQGQKKGLQRGRVGGGQEGAGEEEPGRSGLETTQRSLGLVAKQSPPEWTTLLPRKGPFSG